MAAGEGSQRPDRYGQAWAEVYDSEHSHMVPADEQLELLARLAGDGQALELGVGTGRVALPLAARGVDVHGLDASPLMVAKLRAKPGGDALSVTIGDMADHAVPGPFRLVYVVFNTFFGLLTQEQQVRCFQRTAALLEPGGAFLLECFVPDVGRFDRGQSLRTVRVTDEEVRLDAGRHDPVAQQVFSNIVRMRNDTVAVHPVRQRYAWPPEIDLMAQIAGLRLRRRTGGWGEEPFTAASQTHVSIYEHAHAGTLPPRERVPTSGP